jgi:hypothetical protein
VAAQPDFPADRRVDPRDWRRSRRRSGGGRPVDREQPADVDVLKAGATQGCTGPARTGPVAVRMRLPAHRQAALPESQGDAVHHSSERGGSHPSRSVLRAAAAKSGAALSAQDNRDELTAVAGVRSLPLLIRQITDHKGCPRAGRSIRSASSLGSSGNVAQQRLYSSNLAVPGSYQRGTRLGSASSVVSAKGGDIVLRLRARADANANRIAVEVRPVAWHGQSTRAFQLRPARPVQFRTRDFVVWGFCGVGALFVFVGLIVLFA